jgi:phenylalanyl-tRNA synthetase beta chain
VLRRHLVGSLLDVFALNERQGREDVAVFEIGKGYGRVGDEAREWTRLGFLLAGSAEPQSWNRAARAYDIDDAKGLVELLARRLGLSTPTYAADTRGFPLHPGRALVATADGGEETLAARIGELHPDVLEQRDLRAQRVVVAEIAILGLDAGRLPRVKVEPIGRFPEVERDLAVIVGESVAAAQVAATIQRHARELLRGLRVFDLYRGAPLAADEKSLAYRLVFGAKDRTLTEAEVDEAVARVQAGLKEDLEARLRA